MGHVLEKLGADVKLKPLSPSPAEYLSDMLARLPELTNHQARELTPAKWLAFHIVPGSWSLRLYGHSNTPPLHASATS